MCVPISQEGILEECVNVQVAKCAVYLSQLSPGRRGLQSVYSERRVYVKSVVSSPRLCLLHLVGPSLT